MQMCPFCDNVYDESEYSKCPFCHSDEEDDDFDFYEDDDDFEYEEDCEDEDEEKEDDMVARTILLSILDRMRD